MNIQTFMEEMRDLDLKPGDAITIEYSTSHGIRIARGAFVRIDHDYPKRVVFIENDDLTQAVKASFGKERSLCHRCFIRIADYDFTVLRT